jgi:hypothetical protein
MSLRTVDLIGGFSNNVEVIKRRSDEAHAHWIPLQLFNAVTVQRKNPDRISIRVFLKFYPAGAV